MVNGEVTYSIAGYSRQKHRILGHPGRLEDHRKVKIAMKMRRRLG